MDRCSLRLDTIKRDLLKAYCDEENFWKQKSKDKWIIHGDGNTKVSHSSIKVSRSRDEVVKLIDPNGVAHRYEASKAQVAINYFQDLFSSSNTLVILKFLEAFLPESRTE